MYQTVNNFFKKIIGVDTTEKNSFLDDYDLKEKVGSGAYSVVFKSVRKSDDKYVAIKIVNRTSIRLEERESLNRESLILKSIHHPTILPLQEIYEEEFETILVSEWLEEGDLLSYIRRTDHYKEAECMGWVKDLLVGMESLHSMGVFVRGLKPESVLMRGNRIVIADVVFTHHLINDDVKFCVASSYASPEVITPSKNIGLSSEAAGDVWALGVLLYILISGKHPFVDMATLGQSDPHTLHQSLVANILRGQVDFSSPIWLSSSFSLSARDMVASMLNIDPLRRPSMQALLADHAKWLDQAKDMSQNTKELTESLQHLKQWNLEKRFKYQEHGAHVAARYNIASSRHPPSSSTSSLSSASSSHSNDNETLSDWLKKAEFSLALAPGFLGSYAQIGALKAISEVVELSPGGNVFAICGTSAGVSFLLRLLCLIFLFT